MKHFEYAMDMGGQAPSWIICTDIGGRTFLRGIVDRQTEAKVIWTADLSYAKQFTTLGELAEAFAVIPESFEAYEERPDFIDRHTL
jgi:hypothetical protein